MFYKNPEQVVTETANEYLSNPKICLFVAEDNSKLVGYICGQIKKKPHKIYGKEGYVEDWYVHGIYQKKGVGRALFEKLTEAFKKAGCTHMMLDTFYENNKAIKIYEHMGFTKRLITFFKLI